MKKTISFMLVLICAFCTILTGCGEEGSFGEFYPYDLNEYVTVGDYLNAEVIFGNATITTEDIEARVKSDIASKNLITKREKTGPIVKGDTAIIDYVGYIDGKTFQGGTATAQSIVIGSNSLITGFEEGLIGKKAGEKVTLDLTFPEDYYEEFRGKAVIFVVNIKRVTEAVYPELTNELAEIISGKKTVDEYYASIEKELKAKKEAEIAKSDRENFIVSIIDCCEILKYPDDEVEEYAEKFTARNENIASQYGLALGEYVSRLGYETMADFEEKMRESAKKMVAEEMVFLCIALKEGLSINSKEFDAGVEKYMGENGYTSRETFLNDIGADKLRGILLIDKTIDYLMDLRRALQ